MEAPQCVAHLPDGDHCHSGPAAKGSIDVGKPTSIRSVTEHVHPGQGSLRTAGFPENGFAESTRDLGP